jgi:hypothetical protein
MNSDSPQPTPEQEQRAKWDLLLLDIELRTQQVIHMKRFETWKALATLLLAAAALGTSTIGAILWLAQHIR